MQAVCTSMVMLGYRVVVLRRRDRVITGNSHIGMVLQRQSLPHDSSGRVS